VADTLGAGDLKQGDKVEVLRRFDAQWARGFEVVRVDADGIHVRRMSDGEVLPVAFPPEEIRRERKRNSMWWM
jgi:hypothetical protein